jgi:short subunit fatty acids transporter
MKKNYIILTILILIILVAVITNPDQNRHKEVIKNELITYLQKSIKKDQGKPNDEYEEAGQALGILLGGMIIEKVLDNFMSTDNYVVFSTTKITWEGEKKIIGIGAFGNVFLTKKLEEALNKGLLNDK